MFFSPSSPYIYSYQVPTTYSQSTLQTLIFPRTTPSRTHRLLIHPHNCTPFSSCKKIGKSITAHHTPFILQPTTMDLLCKLQRLGAPKSKQSEQPHGPRQYQQRRTSSATNYQKRFDRSQPSIRIWPQYQASLHYQYTSHIMPWLTNLQVNPFRTR